MAVDAELDRRGASPSSRAQKLHSLTGVVPLGAFLVLHLWITASIVGSRAIYDRQIGFVHGGALLGVLEVVLVLVPLGYHAVYGVWRSLQPRDPKHAYANDLMLVLQRASGVVVLVFVVAHLWELRVQTWTSGLPVSAYSTKLVEDLSATSSGIPWIALGYLVGIGATVFHLVNGMTSFCTTWGCTPTVASQRGARAIFRVAGIVLFALGAGIVIQLATGSRLFPVDEPGSASLACGSAAVTPPPPARASATPSVKPRSDP
jgi:succinate dehydrogenase/fumarate reductase cytochrome b subunit (b558 family)